MSRSISNGGMSWISKNQPAAMPGDDSPKAPVFDVTAKPFEPSSQKEKTEEWFSKPDSHISFSSNNPYVNHVNGAELTYEESKKLFRRTRTITFCR